MMSLRSLLPGPLPVTAPLVLLAVERATVEKGAD
jgi:hypothetical protein